MLPVERTLPVGPFFVLLRPSFDNLLIFYNYKYLAIQGILPTSIFASGRKNIKIFTKNETFLAYCASN